MVSQFLQAVAVAAGGGVRGNLKDSGNFFEGVFMPDLQDDDLALVLGEACETANGLDFSGGFAGGVFEPALGFEFAGDAPPQAAAVVQCAVAVAADAVMLGFGGGLNFLHERDKCLLQNIFGFGVAESKGPAIEDELGGLRFVKPFAPTKWLLDIHASIHA